MTHKVLVLGESQYLCDGFVHTEQVSQRCTHHDSQGLGTRRTAFRSSITAPVLTHKVLALGEPPCDGFVHTVQVFHHCTRHDSQGLGTRRAAVTM
ncbi:hypothetical protein J6590_086111 [Homalodisca vitripennis]|nr:hypothetical protein J6590_086111 [Homalodisca vitripennis]